MMWKTVNLGDVCSLQNGFAFKSSLFKDEGLPILRISNIQNEKVDIKKLVFFHVADYDIEFSRYEVHMGDLLIAMSGATTGKLGFNDSQTTFYLNQRVGKLVPSNVLDKQFLYYFLSTKVDENLNISKGAAQPNLSSEQIRNITFQLPPLDEQKRIAAILDQADALRRLSTRALDKLNTLGQAIFHEMFGADTSRNVNLGDVCGFVRGPFGGSLKKEIFKSEGFAVFEQQHAIKNQFSEIRYFVDEAKFNEMKRFELLPGELIMSCSGTMGKVAIAPENVPRGIINQALLKMSPQACVDVNFLLYWMESDNFQQQLEAVTSGAAIKNVASVGVLKQLKFPLPPLDKQSEFSMRIENVEAMKTSTQMSCITAETLFASLQHRAFRGEL